VIRYAPIAAALTLAAIAAAPSTARDREEVPPATPTGPAVDCVPIRSLGSSAVRNDRVIDFLGTGGRGYRVTLPDACPGLGFEQAFSYRTSLSQLCKQDIITVIRQGGGGIPGPSCGLAEFQPIQLAKRR
jgi:hypothetical protein